VDDGELLAGVIEAHRKSTGGASDTQMVRTDNTTLPAALVAGLPARRPPYSWRAAAQGAGEANVDAR